MTPEQALARAEKLRNKAAKLDNRALIQEVNELMTKHPAIVADVLRTAREKARQQLVLCPGPDNPAATLQPAQPQQTTLAQTIQNGNGETDLEPLLARTIERQYYTIGLLPCKDLITLLYSIDKVAFTPWSLKALLVRGQREPSRGKLCELVEFCSGLPASWQIDNSIFRTVGDS
eukprot:3892825-Amphidinium_carterae.1